MTMPGGQWNDLSQRLLSGGAAAVVGLGAVWLGGAVFEILVSVIAGIIIWEVVRMIGGGGLALPFGIFAGLALLLLVNLPAGFALPLLFAPALVGIAKFQDHRAIYGLFAAAILVAGYGLISLRGEFGFIWMAWLAFVVIFSDILGYFAGRMLGGPKFWPKISPKKTWSGTVAGWIGAAGVGLVVMLLGYAGPELLGFSVALAMAGQMGDMAESALKRQMGVKDSSAILPGHGGMFDRFDSMLGASIFLLFVGRVVDFPPVAM